MKLRAAFLRAIAPFRTSRGRRRVVAEPEALRIEWEQGGRSGVARLPWGDVERAVAFKRDLWAVDLVCLAFEAGGQVYEIDEEMDGWGEVLDALPARLPGCLGGPAIVAAVVKPPFATSETVAYDRRAVAGGPPAGG